MNIDDLQSVQSRERQASGLQNLRPSFYGDVGEFIEQLRDERTRAVEAADDPFASPDVRQLTDDIETAKQTVEALYERRVGKVVKMASISAAGMPVDDDGLTDEERDLYATLVGHIEENRETVLSVLDGNSPSTSSGNEASTDAGTDPAPDRTADSPVDSAPDAPPDLSAAEERQTDSDAAAFMGEGPSDSASDDDSPREVPPERESGRAREGDESGSDSDPPGTGESETPAGEASVSRTTVRITRDIGEIFGTDQRTYHLAAEDVVTLPADNAEPLIERDAAEKIQ